MNLKALGIVLIIVGIIMTIYTGFNYVTTEKVAVIGPIEINKEKTHPVQWTPIIGMLVMAAGIFIVLSSKTKNK